MLGALNLLSSLPLVSGIRAKCANGSYYIQGTDQGMKPREQKARQTAADQGCVQSSEDCGVCIKEALSLPLGLLEPHTLVSGVTKSPVINRPFDLSLSGETNTQEFL